MVNKLGFIGLNAKDIDGMSHYYSQVMGLPVQSEAGKEVYLSCGPDHHALSLVQSEAAGIRHMGLEIGADESLERVMASLKDIGVDADIESDPMAGLARALRFTDPDGATVYLYNEMAKSERSFGQQGILPSKLGHIAYYVESAQRSEKFYTEAMGFRWSDWIEDLFVFMRCNKDHHSVNFIASPQRGMFHFAFELKDASHLIRAADILAQNDVRLLWGPGRHGAGHNLYIYHHDPDGNVVEYFTELDVMVDEAAGYFEPRPYHEDKVQRPKVWKRSLLARNQWGVMPNAEFGPKALNEKFD